LVRASPGPRASLAYFPRISAISATWHGPCNHGRDRREAGAKVHGSKTMFNFETIRNGAIAALFSIVLTATAVGAAVGPSQIGQPAPAASARA
jgi:hypothetical protein